MSLTIQNTAAVEAVNAVAPVQPLARRMAQEHLNAMGASPVAADEGLPDPEQGLPAPEIDPVAPDQDENAPCDRGEETPSEDLVDEADVLMEKAAGGARANEAAVAMRLRPFTLPTAAIPEAPAKSAFVHPSITPPEASDTVAHKFQRDDAPGRPVPAARPAPAAHPAPTHATAQGPASSDGTVDDRRSAVSLASNPVTPGPEAPRVPDAAVMGSRTPGAETASIPGRHEGNATPLPGLNMQDAAARHSADSVAGEAGQARGEANAAHQRTLQHVQQAQKTAEALARRATAGARMDVAFTSWGPGNSVAMTRQLGGHWMATPSNARVGQALGSSTTPDGLQVRLADENLRVESDGASDPDGRRRQQQEHDTP